MRLLKGPRPHVDVLEVIVLALEGERTGPGPALHHQVVRLLEARVRERRVDAHRVVFGADAAHHAADQPPAGDAVEHGVLLGGGLAQAKALPRIAIFAFLVRRESADAITTGDGIRPWRSGGAH
jgi:hypothetical protein